MLEETLISWIGDNLGIPCYAETPEEAPEEFIVVEKTGEGIKDRIATATIAMQFYSDTLYSAGALCEEAIKALLGEDVPDVGGIHLSTSYNYTDTTKKKYRYQAVFLVTYRKL